MANRKNSGRSDYGQVEIDLGDEIITLKPTITAMQKIDRQFGSIREAVQQVSSLSFGAVAFVISAGSGMGQTEAKDLPDRLFRAGLMNVAPQLSEYLGMLLNPSGRNPDEQQEEGGGTGNE